MSKIVLKIEYDSQIWMANREEHEYHFFEHIWGENKIRISDANIMLDYEILLSEDEQIGLIECLAKETVQFIPHWQSLTPDLYRTVQRIEKQIWEAACYIDHCLRKSSKGIRLTALKVPTRNINLSQAYPVMYWEFSEEEKIRLSPLFESFEPQIKQQYEKGILIPFSVSFDQKTIYLRDEEVQDFFEMIDNTIELPPFWSLYGIAWENFSKNKANDSAILILTTSIETALKWCLQQEGGDISNYLIENMQSPSLDKLFVAVSQFTTYELPEHFKGWLKQLAQTRNYVAHKPRGVEIETLQIVRWFAMGEAILKAIIKKENHPHIGFLIKPIGERAEKDFPPDSIGVILRQERFQYGDNRMHVIMDSGESYYFSDNTFEVLSSSKQKFPDVQ